jgi:ubiquinone/menaquinone biosynthesis C-methylase UbiE
MDAIGLEAGMTIADIGAGRGRYTVWFADRVGPEGKVLANDIDREALAHLRARCRGQGLDNVETVLGGVTDPGLPEGVVDIAFMINVYHHLDQPVELVRRLLPTLGPGGVVAIVECDPDKGGFDRDHGTSKAEMLRQLKEAGLAEIEVIDPPWLEHDYIYLGRPAAKETPRS